jgi:protein-tyrosine phosphatase
LRFLPPSPKSVTKKKFFFLIPHGVILFEFKLRSGSGLRPNIQQVSTNFIISLFKKQQKDAAFPDGQTPPPEVRDQWFSLLKEQFRTNPNTCVAIHCVAGLGRAPVMVALALMELGMSYEEAVELIRSKRKGALNSRQLEFLEKYRPRHRLKTRNNACSIM